MKPLKFKEGFKYLKFPALASIKYDGEFQKVSSQKLVNLYGRERFFSFLKNLPSDYIFYGELIVGEGKNFYSEFLPNKISTDESIFTLKIFDLEVDYYPFFVRRVLLENIFNQLSLSSQIQLIETVLIKSLTDAKKFFNETIKKGYEGVVFYPKDADYMVKVKVISTYDVYVLGLRKSKYSVLIGTKEGKILGHASLSGHPEILEAIKKLEVIEETDEDYLIEPKVVIEVKAFGYTKDGKLRHPQILRRREEKEVKDELGDVSYRKS